MDFLLNIHVLHSKKVTSEQYTLFKKYKVLIRTYLNLATPLINNKRSEVSIHVNTFTNNSTQLIVYQKYQENTNLNNQNNTFTYNFKLYHSLLPL